LCEINAILRFLKQLLLLSSTSHTSVSKTAFSDLISRALGERVPLQ